MQKKQKIKPENKKLENYLEAPFHSPSRSSCVLTRGLLPLYFIVVFLRFFFKGVLVCHLDGGELTQVGADNSCKLELFLFKGILVCHLDEGEITQVGTDDSGKE